MTLINQSTVQAAGGFPYTISTPGSYKLSGNLVAPNGQAILVTASNVSIDLNGFDVACTFPNPGSNYSNPNLICIGDTGSFFVPSGISDVKCPIF